MAHESTNPLTQECVTTRGPDGSIDSTGMADLGLLMALEIGTCALWLLWSRVGDVDLTVQQGSAETTVTLAAAVVVSALVAVAAMGLLRLLAGRRNGRRTWTIIAAVVWALSFLGPMGAPSLAAGLGLASLHVFVGATLLFGLRRLHPAAATND